jgi:hypothetical protein
MELMHGKWGGDYTEEYTAKFRPSCVTPLSQLIYLLYAQVLERCALCYVDATSLCRYATCQPVRVPLGTVWMMIVPAKYRTF